VKAHAFLHGEIVASTRELFASAQQIALTPHQRTLVARNDAALRQRLNEAVFTLYGLSREEVSSISGGVPTTSSDASA
jgi:hypothetical protein